MQNDSFIDQVDLPGAGFNFQDVTDIFIEAANGTCSQFNPIIALHCFAAIQDMEPGEFIFMDDFTLYDAMSAFEVSRHK